jgi:hypothetical protein
MANKTTSMLKLRQVLRYFKEETRKTNNHREEKRIKSLILKYPNSSLHSLKKQQLRR